MEFPASVVLDEALTVVVLVASAETFAVAALVFFCGTAGPTFKGTIVFTEALVDAADETADAVADEPEEVLEDDDVDEDDAVDEDDDVEEGVEVEKEGEEDEEELDEEEAEDELDPPDDPPLPLGVAETDGTADGYVTVTFVDGEPEE